jgi:hypothetical protein
MDPTGVLLPYLGSVVVRSLLAGKTPDEQEWAGLAEAVLRALVAQESAVAAVQETLDRLDRKVDRALLQDYEHSLGTALRTLGDAASYRRTADQRMRGLDEARHDLHRAYAAAPDLVARVEVQELISTTWLLAQSPHDALNALQDAATLLRDALYATTIHRADIRAEIERRKQETKETASTFARARLWWADKSGADAVHRTDGLVPAPRDQPIRELIETRERENSTAAGAIADRLRRVQATRRGLGLAHADAPMPVTRARSVGFRSDQDSEPIYSFIAGWEPPGLDAESARYALFVAKQEQFQRSVYEDASQWTAEQRDAYLAAYAAEITDLMAARTASWPPAAPGQWSWRLERAGPTSR